MELNKIVDRVNTKLAGELLTYNQIVYFLDAVVDEINTQLNAKFPVFSEFDANFPQYPNYDFFPDKYIRSVVIPGCAYHFYMTDEEGISSATDYQREFQMNMFYMVRDYSMYVPEEYQIDDTGYLPFSPSPTKVNNWRERY